VIAEHTRGEFLRLEGSLDYRFRLHGLPRRIRRKLGDMTVNARIYLMRAVSRLADADVVGFDADRPPVPPIFGIAKFSLMVASFIQKRS
jgi:hypothetical protein